MADDKVRGMTLQLSGRDARYLKKVMAHSGSRRKAPAIRSVLKSYAGLLEQQEATEARGKRLMLVEVDDGGEQNVVVEHLNLDL